MSFEDAVRLSEGTGYEEEDTSSTTPRELRGWYSYAIAAEVFAVVGVGLFIPVLLEQLPRERGFLFSDRSKPCVDPLGSGEAGRFRARDGGVGDDEQCVVRFLGGDVTTTSFAMYTTSAAVLVQAITLICFSSFADYGPYRKRLLLTFAYTGATVCALFLFLTSRIYYLAPFLVIISVTCLGSGFSLLNAFLPLLVANHPSNRKSPPSSSASTYELDGVAPHSSDHSDSLFEKTTQDLERSSQISSKGVSLGYASAVLFQLFSILLLILFNKLNLAPGNPTLPLRVTLFLVAIWWLVFTLPTHLWLLPRPGPPLPNSRSSTPTTKRKSPTFYLTFSIRSFWHTLRSATLLPQLLKFLLAWFLLSDSISTISSTAILFAHTELHLSTIPLVLLSLTSIFSSMLGATLWPRVAHRFCLSPKAVLIRCIAGLELIPLYGLLAFLPAIRSLGVGGIQRPWEIYLVGIIHGLVMGGISAYARSVYGGLVPRGKEAAFFALYAVTDKGSSAVGPAVVGRIVDRWGTIRPAFWFLAVLVVVPGPVLWWVDVEKGAEDVRGGGEGRGEYVRVGEEEEEEEE